MLQNIDSLLIVALTSLLTPMRGIFIFDLGPYEAQWEEKGKV